MSRYISNLAVAEFDKEVKQQYAQNPQLRQLVRVKSGVIGATCRFQKMSQGIATKKVPQADVVPMNIDYSYVTAVLEDWNAPDYSDIFDAPKVNFNEKRELAIVCASSIGRREDQLIIDALAAGATKHEVPVEHTGDTDTMNTYKFRSAKRILDYQNVPGTDRAIVMSSEALFSMLGDANADTFDKNAIKALVQGELTVWLGFRIYTIGYMQEGGLPITDLDVRSAFAFHKSSIGHAVGMNMRSEINYIATKTSWLINSLFSAGTIAIDQDGMVTILHKEGV
jgi:hypothetical protein